MYKKLNQPLNVLMDTVYHSSEETHYVVPEWIIHWMDTIQWNWKLPSEADDLIQPYETTKTTRGSVYGFVPSVVSGSLLTKHGGMVKG